MVQHTTHPAPKLLPPNKTCPIWSDNWFAFKALARERRHLQRSADPRFMLPLETNRPEANANLFLTIPAVSTIIAFDLATAAFS